MSCGQISTPLDLCMEVKELVSTPYRGVYQPLAVVSLPVTSRCDIQTAE